MKKKILSLIAALLLVCTALTSCVGGTANETTGGDTTAATTDDGKATDTSMSTEIEKYDPGKDENAEVNSVYTENFAFSNAQIGYIIKSAYQNLLYQLDYYYNGDYSVVGLDVSKSLKEQACGIDESAGTWYDYFESSAIASAKEVLALCEAAKAAGFTLPDEAQKELDGVYDDFLEYAEKENMTVDEYLAENIGEDVTIDVLKDTMEKSYIAQYYMTDVIESIDVSDAALEAKYNENPDVADRVDYLLFPFEYASLIPEDADDAAIEEAKNTCRAAATDVAKATDEESFKAALVQHLVDDFGYDKADAENEADTVFFEKSTYVDDPVLNWLFDAEVGKAGVIEDENYGVVYVCYLVERHGRDESAGLRDVRHILFKHETYDDDTTVQQVYADWVKNGATVDDFIALAAEYSEDPGSAKNGGLYEGVTAGEMVDEFNDWLFDEARVEGDHAIVESKSFGWHIMYYEGGGEPAWKSTVTSYLQTEAQSKTLADAMAKYEITIDEEILESIPA